MSWNRPGASRPIITECVPTRRTTMAIRWTKDADAAFAEAKASGKSLLFDFNAAPM